MTQKKAGGRKPSNANNETRKAPPRFKSGTGGPSGGTSRPASRATPGPRSRAGEAAPARSASRAASSLSASPTYGKKRPVTDGEPRSESKPAFKPASRAAAAKPARATAHAKPRKDDRSSPRAAEEAPGGRRGRVPAERPHRTTDARKKPAARKPGSGFGPGAARPSRAGAAPGGFRGKPALRERPRREREPKPDPTPRPMEWNEVRHIKVDANSDGQRIDNFLMKHLPGVPKSAVYRLVRSGQVRVDGGRAKPERKLVAAESVRIPPVRLQDPAEAVRPPDRVLNELRESVIHEDAHYLVINKPEGLSSHGGTGQLYGVIEAIRAWEKYEFIELCHRLDRDTSGVLLLAKSRPALLRAQRAFKNHELTKRYFALVHGRWKGEDRDCDAALVKVRLGDQHHVQLDEEGKPSLSRFSPRNKYKDATLCEVEIFSGRTHQIRVHALALGHPVVGDAKYGERDQNHPMREKGLKRMFLHAHFLQLKPEGDFPKLLLNAPMPDELRNFLQKL